MRSSNIIVRALSLATEIVTFRASTSGDASWRASSTTGRTQWVLEGTIRAVKACC